VLHLHGVAKKPDSIILSSADYQRLSGEQLTQILDKSLFASHRFIFIGCGDGLHDPNIAPLIDFVNTVMPKKETEHYILVKGDQLRQFNERQLSPLISPVAYGSDFRDLTPFLQKLAAGEEIEVSQDPRYYESRTSARPGPALLSIAGQALQKLQGALAALYLAERAMRKVEQHSAMSAGMNDWDYGDQEAVHEELAASLTDPATHFESCAAQVIPAFENAEADVWKLTAPKFAKHAARLTRVSGEVLRLENVSEQLLDRATRVRDDLRARTDVCADYRMPYEALYQAHGSIDQARSIAVSLKEGLEGLGRLQAAQAAEKTEPVPPAAQTSDAASAVSEQNETVERAPQNDPDVDTFEQRGTTKPDFRRVPLLWKVAAGKPMLADEDNVRDYLAMPTQHVRGDEIFMFEVSGDSMAGEDGVLDGDYVIVDRRGSWKDGDMVVVLVGGDEGAATVKRLWREGAYFRLESSNPAYKAEFLREEDEPTIQGKVIGVVRWHIKEGRRRTEPSS
jgi:SOS-response transcriptional repressor LexA